MYMCEDCGNFYSEPITEFDGSDFDTPSLSTCECGRRLVETGMCKVCGKWFPTEDYAICNSCVEECKTLENALSMGAECTENIAINGFLAFYFGGIYVSELEDILKAEILKKMQTDEQVVLDVVDKYCEFDRTYFIEWLEDKWNTEK